MRTLGVNYLLTPGKSCFVEIETFDHLGNLITEGGNASSFSFRVKNKLWTSDWEDIELQVNDLENGTYEIFFCIQKVGIFDLEFKFNGSTIPSDLCMSVLPRRFFHLSFTTNRLLNE